jgi:hypothetical protein
MTHSYSHIMQQPSQFIVFFRTVCFTYSIFMEYERWCLYLFDGMKFKIQFMVSGI